jgi:hypothetical protein
MKTYDIVDVLKIIRDLKQIAARSPATAERIKGAVWQLTNLVPNECVPLVEKDSVDMTVR